MRYFVIALICLSFIQLAYGEHPLIPIPESIGDSHPRLHIGSSQKGALKKRLREEIWAMETYENILGRINKYVDRHQEDPEWMVSRLQMYWQNRHTDVYINGGVFSHAEGEAPVPTVRFSGTRDSKTNYLKPNLEDILPYMGDEQGLYLQNRTLTDRPWEWVEPSASGRIIEGINRDIMGLAQDAAFIYWMTGQEKYAIFSANLFDTYMTGMYYRNEPIDLSRGHHQTLVGLSSFEVIQEHILNELTACYDFLHDYLAVAFDEKMHLYGEVFKKWADQIIRNGVTHNNWNLHQARFIARIAIILEDNAFYEDGKGAQYYLDQIMNQTSQRQWSMPKLLDYGYDMETGIWNESPGYAMGMVSSFLWFVEFFDRHFGIDILPYMPVLPKAVTVLPQYLHPNGYAVSFGDSRYSRLSGAAMRQLIQNAQLNKKTDQETYFTAMLKWIQGEQAGQQENRRAGNSIFSLLDFGGIELSEDIPAGQFSDYVTSTFYAPNTSHLIQRNGLDPENGLMVSKVASLGNHAHANGIAIELYGKGLVLAPEKGIGGSYWSVDYLEFYSQFPAHNTVIVDGISSYPVMKSNHPFSMNACYPAPGKINGYYPMASFSDVFFREPETYSAQNRVTGIVRTSESSGYYVDIFRSGKIEGGDKYHDYFYHNLGQELILLDADGSHLTMEPTQRLAFTDGDIWAYDYFFDKNVSETDNDFRAVFELALPMQDKIQMHMWMQGNQDREIFSVRGPRSTAFRNAMIPDSIAEMSVPAVVVRQHGEAWSKPFVAIYEPCRKTEGSSIRSIQSMPVKNASPGFAGVEVENHSGRIDYIFSSTGDMPVVSFQDMRIGGNYAIVSKKAAGEDITLFLGHGEEISGGGFGIRALGMRLSATLEVHGDQMAFTCDQDALLIIPEPDRRGRYFLTADINGEEVRIPGTRFRENGERLMAFQMTAMPFSMIKIRKD